MAEITLEQLTKVYGDGTRAVSDLDLEIADGEFVVLVGPSGCGKTTALRMVAGLEPITEGRVLIGGEVVNKLPPKDRDIAMIFQNYALYPHMSAFDNMAFGLKLRGMKRDRRGQRVKSTAGSGRPPPGPPGKTTAPSRGGGAGGPAPPGAGGEWGPRGGRRAGRGGGGGKGEGGGRACPASTATRPPR